MWRAYTSSSESVVITTSSKSLRSFLPDTIMKYAVKYAPLDFPRTEFTHNALFYYKPSSYTIEREYLLRSPDENEIFHPDNPEHWFRRVPIKTRKTIHRELRIHTHHKRPNSKWTNYFACICPAEKERTRR